MSPQLKGTLDSMVFETLEAMFAIHGSGIARRIEPVGKDTILLNRGTIYVSPVRLQPPGLIRSERGTSGNNRRAKFYSITLGGSRRQAETARMGSSFPLAPFHAAHGTTQKEPYR
jgi:PadR family transcriptional regulator PadR